MLPALMFLIAAAAAAADAVVYGPVLSSSASPLRDNVPLSAFLGGMALAFSRSFLLVLVPYFAVLSRAAKPERARRSGPRIGWGLPVAYLLAFALTFIVTISGVPRPIASPIYGSESVVDPAGGIVFFLAGVVTILGVGPGGAIDSSSPVWKRAVGVVCGGLFGVTTGALMYHELDPVYDSVFFSTANAVVASHAPATVALFTAGLGIVYVAAGVVAITTISRTRWGRGAFVSGRVLSGTATALIGVALLSGRFGVVRGLLV
jgi:cytochrome c biogenesis protein CcdA